MNTIERIRIRFFFSLYSMTAFCVQPSTRIMAERKKNNGISFRYHVCCDGNVCQITN